MKLHTKNGKITTEHGEFLPEVKNSEYEVDSNQFKTEVVTVHRDTYTEYLKPGKYTKVTALVKVTRYYPIKEVIE